MVLGAIRGVLCNANYLMRKDAPYELSSLTFGFPSLLGKITQDWHGFTCQIKKKYVLIDTDSWLIDLIDQELSLIPNETQLNSAPF